MNDTICHQLIQIAGEENVHFDVSMASLTSFKIGGPADAVVDIHQTEDLKNVVAFADEKDISYFLIGNGTNLLVSDGGYRGIIVNTRTMSNIKVKDTMIICERLLEIYEKVGLKTEAGRIALLKEQADKMLLE